MRTMMWAAVLMTGASMMSSAMAAEILLDRLIAYAPDSAPEAVRRECQLQTLIPERIREESDGLVAFSGSRGHDAAGTVLEAWIVHVNAQPGGKYSGHKSVTVAGELKRNGTVIGSFTTRRERGSAVAWRGTCSILRVAAEDAAKDVARWLRKPQMHSLLGKATAFEGRGASVAPAVSESIAPSDSVPAPEMTASAAAGTRIGVARQGAQLRGRPTQQGAAVQSIAAGTRLQLESQLQNSDGIWWYVPDLGSGGWVNQVDLQ
jgi:hypothetical protein